MNVRANQVKLHSFNDFLLMALQKKRDNPNLRMGQVYFNVFHSLDPEHADFLRTLPTIDCYYRDDNIGNFLYEVSVTWETRRHRRDEQS